MNIFDWARVMFGNRSTSWWAVFCSAAAASLTVLILIMVGIGSCTRHQAELANAPVLPSTTTTKPTLSPAEAFAVSAADAPAVHTGSALMAGDGKYIYYSFPGDNGGIYREPIEGGASEKLRDQSGAFCIMKGDLYFLGDPNNGGKSSENGASKILKKSLNLDNSELETVYSGSVYDFAAEGGKLYFLSKSNDTNYPNSLCSIRPGDEKPEKIYSGGFIPFTDGNLLYWYGGKGVYSIRFDGTGKTQLTDEVRISRAVLAGDWVYYLMEDAQELRRVQIGGKSTEILARSCGDFTTDGLYIYIIGANTDKDKNIINAKSIIRINMDGSGRKLLCEANVHQLTGAADGWVFFHEWTNGDDLLRRVRYNGADLGDVRPVIQQSEPESVDSASDIE